MTAPEPEWTDTGVQQEVTGQRQVSAEERFEADYAYAVKSQTHLWVITVSHRATDGTLDVFDGKDGTPLLDGDTMLMRPVAGCYVCEQAYEPRLRRRKCTGEPKDGGRR